MFLYVKVFHGSFRGETENCEKSEIRKIRDKEIDRKAKKAIKSNFEAKTDGSVISSSG